MSKLTNRIAAAGAALLLVVGVAAMARPHGGHGMGLAPEMDVDADGKFSEAVLAAALSKRAASMDANGDGFIVADEVEAYHQARKAERRAARFARMSEALDANSDGKLSVEEFATGTHDRMMKRDADGDGAIMPGEGRRGHREGRRPPMPPQD